MDEVGALSSEQEYTGRHYDGSSFTFESERLEKHCPVEFAITCRYLKRYVPTGSAVTDVGVGVGHYAELLARMHCLVSLVDVSQNLLKAAHERLIAAGLGDRVNAVHRASASQLGGLASSHFDVVLMLGPLYHLRDPVERAEAVKEASRVLKPGGILFAAGVNRLAYLRDLFREHAEGILSRKDFHKRFLVDGKLDPEHAPPIGYAHLTTVSEFRGLFAAAFEELVLTGTDSFTTAWQGKLVDLRAEAKEAWLDLVEGTGATPEGLGQSDHFLFIGRKW
jgi:ubiquinone/menaquinone biosynthesis C-methylase UbiE